MRDVVLHIFKDTEVCFLGGTAAAVSQTTALNPSGGASAQSIGSETCAGGMEALKPINYAQFMANAIAKIQQQPSPTVVGSNKQVSELAKAFTHLSSEADTVEVGQEPDSPPPAPPPPSSGNVPIFLGLVFIVLGCIGAAIFFLRHNEMMQHLKGMEGATAAYAAMMTKVTEASAAAFGYSGGDNVQKRSAKKRTEQIMPEPSSASSSSSSKPKVPTLQEKLTMLREANSAAGIKRSQK